MSQERNSGAMAREANRLVLTRTIVLMILFGLVIFAPLIWQLYQLQIVRHDELEKRAVRQQTSEMPITANRGTIYDADGNVLAISSTVYDVVISPKAIVESQQELDKKREAAQKKGDDTAPYDWNVEDVVVSNLSSILSLDAASLREKCADTDSQYKRLAQKVERDREEQIRELIESYDIGGCIYLQPNAKRYYPNADMAAQIIGFTNDKGGAYGLESKYEAQLAGTPGLLVTAKNGRGTDLMNFFQDYYDPEDGNDLHLTLDPTIQSFCQSALEQYCERYETQNGGVILVMECKTGRMLGMAQMPTFDLNNYTEVTDETLLSKVEKQAKKLVEDSEKQYQQALEKALAELSQPEQQEQTGEASEQPTQEQPTQEQPTQEQTASAGQISQPLLDENGNEITVLTYDEAYQQAYSSAIYKQWTNKCITDTYEPGSTFKALVLAAGLEEGVINENSTFDCSGSVQVDTWTIRCSSRSGHGHQNLAEAIGHSCNPALISIGQKLGRETFYEYMERFGILDPTGIDLPYENVGKVWPYDEFHITQLATASFGQRFELTPIQLITAFNAVVNGGYLYTPHVVQSINDSTGSIVYQADERPARQVISEETSRRCREILEGVVSKYTGNNAYQPGYRIGGKTGTAQTLVKGEYWVSFVGFAPADDPDIITLVMFDRPKSVDGTSTITDRGDVISGGAMAAPVAGELIARILDYRGYEKGYSSSELTGSLTPMPDCHGMTEQQAKETLSDKKLKYRTVGSGDTVTGQLPDEGRSVPQNSTVILYMGEEMPSELVEMPDLYGKSPKEAMDIMNEAGIFMRAESTNGYYTKSSVCTGQEVSPGTMVRRGHVFKVTFTDSSGSNGG